MSPQILNRCALLGAVLSCMATPVVADFSFSHNGRNYKLVTTRRTWFAAHNDAKAQGGILAKINDAAENNAIRDVLISQNVAASASLPLDGSGARFVWIGGYHYNYTTPPAARLPENQRKFAWVDQDNNATDFWTGGKNGAPANGAYTNWGRAATVGGIGPEPDDHVNLAGGIDNGTGVGMAAQAWPVSGSTKIGQAGQWNDLDEDANTLFYVIEFLSKPAAPTGVTLVPQPNRQLKVSWQDNSSNATAEDAFALFIGIGSSTTPTFLGTLPANETSFTMINTYLSSQEFQPGTTYRVKIGAFNDAGYSESGLTTVVFRPVAVGGTIGTAVNHSLSACSGPGVTVSGFSSASAIPGLTFHPTTGVFSGTPTQAGVFTTDVTTLFSGGVPSVNSTVTFRIERNPAAPQIAQVLGNRTLTLGTPEQVNLALAYADPDTPRAVRFATVKGNLDLILYQDSTPQTVQNFLNYMGRGDYNGSIIHRSFSSFVVQGGGYKPVPAGQFTKIATDPPVVNEPGLSSVRGTVAMAKVGGNPDSATSEWFFNIVDNSSNLDNQNGGFTVFGRVGNASLSVMDALANSPTGTYAATINGSAGSFQNFPHNLPSAPPTIDFGNLVTVNTVSEIPALAHSVKTNTNPAVATASIVNATLTLTPVAPFGQTTVTVTATDLDGNATDQTFTVSVRDSLAAWTARQSFPNPESAGPLADPDGDGANLLDYAFLRNPLAPDSNTVNPQVLSVVTDASNKKRLALSWSRHKGAVDLLYEVQEAATLAGPWTTIWSSATEGPVERVVATTDQGISTRYTIRGTQTFDTTPRGFMRLKVSKP